MELNLHIYLENILSIRKIMFTCQPMPRLSTEGGNGVALAYLETAI
jgi:hypothetical protein